MSSDDYGVEVDEKEIQAELELSSKAWMKKMLEG